MPIIAVAPESLATLHTVIGAPLAAAFGMAALLGFGRRRFDACVEKSLDELLSHESAAFRGKARADVLDFPTTGWIHAGWVGVAWGWLAGRVRIVRTVRAAIDGGYRVRLRAVARGLNGRVLVRHVDVDVRPAA